jgi:hypothetical protein
MESALLNIFVYCHIKALNTGLVTKLVIVPQNSKYSLPGTQCGCSSCPTVRKVTGTVSGVQFS